METGFLIGLVLFLGWFVVLFNPGHLRLTMIGLEAAAMILPPPLADSSASWRALRGFVTDRADIDTSAPGNNILDRDSLTDSSRSRRWISRGSCRRPAGRGHMDDAHELGADALRALDSYQMKEPLLHIARLAFGRTFLAAFLASACGSCDRQPHWTARFAATSFPAWWPCSPSPSPRPSR